MNNDIEKKRLKSPLKWAGGKAKILEDIRKTLPQKIDIFVEPFVGGGTIFPNIDSPRKIINDINADLIGFYSMIKNEGETFIEECNKMFIKSNLKEDVYEKFKKEFNTTKDLRRKASLFLWLNKHCFNGLCRYNGSGEFNVPKSDAFEKGIVPSFPREEMMNFVQALKNVEIKQDDFRNIIKNAPNDSVLYCDPPYIPLSSTSDFTSYSSDEFTLQDHIDLARLCAEGVEEGRIKTAVISNNYNWYSHQIYKVMFGAKFKKINVTKSISAKSSSRGKTEEIIAIFNKG